MTTHIYQRLIDELCKKYDIPSIPVKVVPHNTLGTLQAYFDNIDYTITVEPGTGVSYVIHEWTHYIIKLIGAVSTLEEDICDIVPKGILHELNNLEEDDLIRTIKEYEPSEEEKEEYEFMKKTREEEPETL